MFCTLEREREQERERERELIFDLQNLVVTLANACHEIISDLRVTALTLNTFVQTLISLAHAHAANKNIISCILTQHVDSSSLTNEKDHHYFLNSADVCW